MRNRLHILLLALISVFIMMSCEFEKADLGYPKIVTFLKSGGQKRVTGTTSFTDAHIHDYASGDDGDILPDEGDAQSEVYRWLKIEYARNCSELRIIAEPNTSGRSRILHIELYSGTEYHVIKVEQE